MSIENEISKELINEAKTLTSEVYKDFAKPAVQEIGFVVGRTVKNLLFPLRGLLWGWEKIEEFLETEVNKRLEKIPEEKRKTPEPEIAVPLIQALTYTAKNETLREMYVNLLVNSMNSDKNNIVHPSFVEVIKQMNTLDAKVFEKILNNNKPYQQITNPKIILKESHKFIVNATPEWYAGWTIEGYSEFDISASFVRLKKFGLIELMFDRKTTEIDGYKNIKNTPYLISILNKCKTENTNFELEIECIESVICINEYGKQFKEACK